MEQLSLFMEENTLFNIGVQQFIDMDFSKSLETLNRYTGLFPWGRDVGREIAMAEFLQARLRTVDWDSVGWAEAEEVYLLWLEFEEKFGMFRSEPSFEREFRKKYFSRLADGLDRSQEDNPRLSRGTPTGVVFLLAGRADKAISSLQALIGAEPNDAMVCGYLGDAYVLRGDLRAARFCYREAFGIAPGEVDIAHLQDVELRERLEAPETNENVEGDFAAWFPVVAQLDGFFEPRILRDLEELREWVGRYLGLLKIYGRDGDKAHVPGLFYHAMVLSDNASIMKFIKEVDLIEVRQRMKQWHPGLFARHMQELEKRGGGRAPYPPK